MYFDDFIEKTYESIREKNNFNKEISNKLLFLKKKLSFNNSDNFVEPIEDINFSGVIAGVDSGFVSKRMSFVDIVLIRTCGAIFTYCDSVLKKADYFPSPVILPKPILLKNGLEKDEELQSVSLERLKEEIMTSIEIIKKYKPNYLFIDGSIVLQYQDKPRKDSDLTSDYKSMINLFEELYGIAQENSTILISTIEDSRGNRFNQITSSFVNSFSSKKELSYLSDTAILDYLLLKKERTFSFPYTQDIESHAILKDYSKKWSKNIFVFYLKPSEFDFPLRVEFICLDNSKLKKVSDEIASIVYKLSSLYREYAYPSILIEADLRARLNEKDISIVYEKLIDKLGSKLVMRRNSRPFK